MQSTNHQPPLLLVRPAPVPVIRQTLETKYRQPRPPLYSACYITALCIHSPWRRGARGCSTWGSYRTAWVPAWATWGPAHTTIVAATEHLPGELALAVQPAVIYSGV